MGLDLRHKSARENKTMLALKLLKPHTILIMHPFYSLYLKHTPKPKLEHNPYTTPKLQLSLALILTPTPNRIAEPYPNSIPNPA